jgi:hypothetical protein
MVSKELDKLEDALEKSVLIIEKGMRDMDRGFSKVKKLNAYKKAKTRAVKKKEKQIELLLA